MEHEGGQVGLRRSEEPVREPPEQVTEGLTFGWALGMIVLGGLVLRVVYTLAASSAPPLSDGYHYSVGARLLADGRGFINPVSLLIGQGVVQDATHPPAWTVFFSLLARLGLDSDQAFRLAAAAIGAATVAMVGLAGREAFGRRVGLIAASIAAIYPNLWLYEHELFAEPAALLGVATLIWLIYRFRTRPGPLAAVALGAVVALCALSRSELILLAVLLVAPTILLVREVPVGRRIGWLALAAVGSLVLITPWFAYNTTRFDEPVPLSAGLGGAMAAGNCPATFEPSSPHFAYYDTICLLSRPLTGNDASTQDGQLRRSAMEDIRADKGGFAVAAVARIGRTMSIYSPFQQINFEAERGSSTKVITAALWSYWALVPFAVVGAIAARRRRVPIYPFVGMLVVILIAVIPTIGAVRYRAPFEIALVILGAVGIDVALRRFAAWRQARTIEPAPALEAAA